MCTHEHPQQLHLCCLLELLKPSDLSNQHQSFLINDAFETLRNLDTICFFAHGSEAWYPLIYKAIMKLQPENQPFAKVEINWEQGDYGKLN